MARVVLAAALAGLVASQALAKDLCFQMEQSFAGTELVLKGVKLSPGAFGPVQGYYARYDLGVTNTFIDFAPLAGQAVVSSQRNLVVGLSFYNTALQVAGTVNALPGLLGINLGCLSGPDNKIGDGDACDAYVDTVATSAHVISCKDAPKLP